MSAIEEVTPLTSNLNGNLSVDETNNLTKLFSTVKSSDGKFHKVVFDLQAKTLEFTLLKNDSHLTDAVLSLSLNEILTVRSNKVKLQFGIPKKNLKRDDEIGNHKNAKPNELFLYYAFRRNIYLWRVREAVLSFTTSTEKKIWHETLKKELEALRNRPKSLYIFINPFGGKGKATKIYHKYVEPFFDLVDINRNVYETKRANHAYDILKSELKVDSWNSIDGVVSVGGDGLFNEVLSASIIRTQEENNKDIEDLNVDSLVSPRFRFGIIGAGSANSIVSSVHGVDDWATAAIHIAIGSRCSVDVCTVHAEKKLLRISANAISYGWLGDVLHDSEHYRCMGPIRYQWSALRTSIRHPTYFGRVSFALSHMNDENQINSIKLPKCTKSCAVCDRNEVEPNYPFHLQTDFTHVICCVIPCVSPFTPYGMAPYAGVGDGSMDLALVPKVSRSENLQIMRKVSMYGGKGLIRLTHNNLYVFRVSRWKFVPSPLLISNSDPNDEGETNTVDTPITSGTENIENINSPTKTENEESVSGAWNLDGEILPQPSQKALYFRLHTRLIDYFGRELDLDDPQYKKCFCWSNTKSFSKIIVIS